MLGSHRPEAFLDFRKLLAERDQFRVGRFFSPGHDTTCDPIIFERLASIVRSSGSKSSG
jgi:hypothetical protein